MWAMASRLIPEEMAMIPHHQTGTWAGVAITSAKTASNVVPVLPGENVPGGPRDRVAGLLVGEDRSVQVNRRGRGEHDHAEGDEEIDLHALDRGRRRIARLLTRDGPDDVEEQDDEERQVGEPRAREDLPELVILLPAEDREIQLEEGLDGHDRATRRLMNRNDREVMLLGGTGRTGMTGRSCF